MPSKTPHTNGKEPVENGINGTKNIEMKDDAPAPMKGGKGKKMKEGEEEMTVVLPPSKASKLSAPPVKDTEGDVAMDGFEDDLVEDAGAVKVDPVAKAVSGSWISSAACLQPLLTYCAFYRHQEQLPIIGTRRYFVRCQIYPPSSSVNLLHPQTPHTRYLSTGYHRNIPINKSCSKVFTGSHRQGLCYLFQVNLN